LPLSDGSLFFEKLKNERFEKLKSSGETDYGKTSRR